MTPDEALKLATEAKRWASGFDHMAYESARFIKQLAAAVEELVEESRWLREQRNWAMAMSYACQEFAAGAITREELDETIKSLTKDAEEQE